MTPAPGYHVELVSGTVGEIAGLVEQRLNDYRGACVLDRIVRLTGYGGGDYQQSERLLIVMRRTDA